MIDTPQGTFTDALRRYDQQQEPGQRDVKPIFWACTCLLVFLVMVAAQTVITRDESSQSAYRGAENAELAESIRSYLWVPIAAAVFCCLSAMQMLRQWLLSGILICFLTIGLQRTIYWLLDGMPGK